MVKLNQNNNFGYTMWQTSDIQMAEHCWSFCSCLTWSCILMLTLQELKLRTLWIFVLAFELQRADTENKNTGMHLSKTKTQEKMGLTDPVFAQKENKNYLTQTRAVVADKVLILKFRGHVCSRPHWKSCVRLMKRKDFFRVSSGWAVTCPSFAVMSPDFDTCYICSKKDVTNFLIFSLSNKPRHPAWVSFPARMRNGSLLFLM